MVPKVVQKRCSHEGGTKNGIFNGGDVSRMEQQRNAAAWKDVRSQLKREEFVAYIAQKVIVSRQTTFSTLQPNAVAPPIIPPLH
jgi:hypothetical protein